MSVGAKRSYSDVIRRYPSELPETHETPPPPHFQPCIKMHRSNENINPKVLTAVVRQLNGLQQEKLDGVSLIVNEDNPLDVQALVEGPAKTPYEGGVFRVKLCLGADFPEQPPKAFFLTKIFHPNIGPDGAVCVNTLKRDWDPSAWSIGHILQVIRCLLINPFPESALNEEAARLFMESYEEFSSHAAMITKVHAKSEGGSASLGRADSSGSAGGGADEEEAARKKVIKQTQKTKKSLKRL